MVPPDLKSAAGYPYRSRQQSTPAVFGQNRGFSRRSALNEPAHLSYSVSSHLYYRLIAGQV